MKKSIQNLINTALIASIYLFSNVAWSQNNTLLDNWMTEDLSVTSFRNGDKIPQAQSNEAWQKASENGTPAFCYNSDDPTKGILYNWAAVNDPRGLAPEGWKIPSRADYEKINSSTIPLKSKGGWDNQEVTFNFLANGYRSYDGNEFLGRKFLSYYWTSEMGKTFHSWTFYIGVDSPKGQFQEERRENGCSVRCVRTGSGKTVNTGNNSGTNNKVVVESKTNTNCISGNCKTGKGVYKYNSGAVYEGDFKDSLRHGIGTMTYSGGDKYVGMWSNNKKHGFGSYEYATGSNYKGMWDNDEKEGIGSYSYSNGDLYVGSWKENEKNGNGKYTWKSGTTYDGEWLKNSYHGYGVMTYSDGTVKKGYWENDVYIGAEKVKETKKVEFTNNSSSKVDLAVAYYDGSSWISVGWYKIEPGKSYTYDLGEYGYTSMYWYAQCLPDNKKWSGETSICVKSAAFKLVDKSNCDERSEKFTKLTLTGNLTKQRLID